MLPDDALQAQERERHFPTMHTTCLWELIGRIIEAYVDDIVIKSKKTGDLVPDLTEVFAKLRQHGVKLNLEKCVFGVLRGMLLVFVVLERGVGANPEKISAIMDMGPIKT
jgi:hypothetical protein